MDEIGSETVHDTYTIMLKQKVLAFTLLNLLNH